MHKSEDEKWMRLALSEGSKGIGLTAPNPAVGAILVKDDMELARGWHRKAGTPHAERDALSKLGKGEARGATAYVTLEPCSTVGRTGACTSALIEAGVTTVVYGLKDPNPEHAGRADEVLRENGIEVRSGVLEKECRHLIRGFAMVFENERPWVIAKTAMSLDGRITRPPGEGQWLSGSEAREEVQMLRSQVEAILISGESVRKDDPALTLRSSQISPEKEQPIRAVMSRRNLERSSFQLFNDVYRDRTQVYLKQQPYEVLRTLAKEHDVTTVLLEAGGNLLGLFHDQGLIDEWVIYLVPMVTGGPSPALGGEGSESLSERLNLEELSIEQIGNDLCARGMVKREDLQDFER